MHTSASTQKANSRPNNPAKDARRQQLINATIDCIYQYGLENTTVARVTSTANLSIGTINFYFSTKDQLLLGVLESVRDEFDDALFTEAVQNNEPMAVLGHIIDIYFDPLISSPSKIAVWHAFSSASRHRADYTQICGEFEARLDCLIRDQFAALCDVSAYSHYRPDALALGLTGILDSLWQSHLYDAATFDRAAAIRQCNDYLDSLFSTRSEASPRSGQRIHALSDHKISDLLPAWTYSSKEFLALEMENLFKPNWMLAAHISELANPRDYVTFEGFGERAMLVCGNDGQIRAFHNVCRHRGARLLDGERGNCPHALSCPFHGWTYDLEGKLIGIPAQDSFGGLEPEHNGLVPLDMEVWMGFVFIRFKPGGKSMREQMAPVEHLVAPYRIDEMTPVAATGYRQMRPYNWKVIHDIDNEGYHVPVGHPSLQQLYGKNYTDDYVGDIPVSRGYLNDKPAKLWSVKRYQDLLPTYNHLPEDHQRLWLYVGIFPNAVIGLYPDCIEFYMTIPRDTHSTWYIGRSFALEDSSRETSAARYLNRRINHITDQEDESFVELLQDGMRSSAFPEQNLSSKEQGVRGFHKAVQDVLPVANLADEPTLGQVGAVNASIAAA